MSTSVSEAPTTAASGTETSPGFRTYLRQLRRTTRRVRITQFLLVAVFLVLWEIAPQMHWINPMLTSYPSAIFTAFVSMAQENQLAMHVWVTFQEVVVSFALSLAIALAVAVALWWWHFLYRVLDPFLVVANALPKIALVPIFYVWLGDTASIYAVAIAIAVFITILMMYDGFRATDPDKIKLVRTFGGTRWQVLTKVVLPASIPTLIGALKINIGLALVGVVAGEFQASKAGLGYLIIYGTQILQMHMVLASIAILAVMSVVMYVLIAWLEQAVLRHRPTASSNT